jgi:chromosome segregation ATPase
VVASVSRLSARSQAKAIAGLEGFRRKLESDLEYVEGKLDAISHVRSELEEHMRRLTEVLQGLNNKTEAERRALDRLTDDFNQLRADREAQMRREEQEREQMHSQLEAEDKMRLGVEEYMNKLTSEMETVGRQLVSERKKNQALELYRCTRHSNLARPRALPPSSIRRFHVKKRMSLSQETVVLSQN